MNEVDTKKNESQEEIYEFGFSNSLMDLIYVLIIRNLSGISLLIISAVAAVSCYFQIFKVVGTSDMFLLLLYIARYILIFFVIIIGYNGIYAIYVNVAGKLKGVVGEHTITFFKDEFVEKTPFNSSKFSYSAVKLFNTLGLYILFTERSGFFAFPKRKISEKDEQMMLSFFSKTPPKKIITPFIVVAFVVMVAAFLFIGKDRSKYQITLQPQLFTMTQVENGFYLNTGRHFQRMKSNYNDYVGFQSPRLDDRGFDPYKDMKMELVLYYVSQNGVEKVDLPQDASNIQIFSFENEAYGIVYKADSQGKKPDTYRIKGGVFIELPEETFKELIKKFRMQQMDNEGASDKKLTEYQFEERSAGKGYVEITIEESPYKIYLKKNDDYDMQMSGKYLLYGVNNAGKKDIFADYKTGVFTVNKDQFDKFDIGN